MLYNEFIEGPGCQDNEKNYKIYKDLEIMYMNSDMSKDDIYEYGKKLVDNSKSEKEIQFENEIRSEIEVLKEELEQYKTWVSDDKARQKEWKEYGDKEMTLFYRNNVRYYENHIKELKNRINSLKWVLA